MPGIIAILTAILAFCLVMLLLGFAFKGKLKIRSRIDTLVNTTGAAGANGRQLKKSRIRTPSDSRVGGKIAQQLESAGILLRADEFLLIWAGAALLPAGLLLFLKASTVTAFAFAAAGAILPPVFVSGARRKRQMLFDRQLGEALAIIGNCLRAGFTFQQAMDSISNEMPDPISREFAKTLREIRLGIPVEAAMESMVKRMSNADLEMLVSAVLIQRQVGGNLAEVIDSIAVTIKDRLKIKGDVRVMTASGRMSGMVIGLLPVIIGALLMVLNPTYIMTFFDTPIGIIMLVVAAVMECVGFFIVQRIADIRY